MNKKILNWRNYFFNRSNWILHFNKSDLNSIIHVTIRQSNYYLFQKIIPAPYYLHSRVHWIFKKFKEKTFLSFDIHISNSQTHNSIKPSSSPSPPLSLTPPVALIQATSGLTYPAHARAQRAPVLSRSERLRRVQPRDRALGAQIRSFESIARGFPFIAGRRGRTVRRIRAGPPQRPRCCVRPRRTELL